MRSRNSWRTARHTVPTAVLSAFVLTACGDTVGPGHHDDHEPAINFQRLVVADAEAPTARVISLQDDQVLQTFTLAEPSSRVYRSHGGRIVGINQRTAGRVNFVDAGVWTHDSDAHRQNAAMLQFSLNDGIPSYENVNGDWMSVFFDGSGVVRWMRESELRSGNGRVAFEANTGGAHHGGAFSIEVGSQRFFAHSTPNPAGGSPNGVAVRNAQGQIVSQLATARASTATCLHR
jgi:hypothetical protein